ncbi:hypothetical protein [Winogradskyella sp.]|uniref:hypothetical protein n=1 Tax=Winogradskyella sp. TaxID=1883156 RepID=UPI0026016E14|nr:hypothetical protein [Winogradskyella sp.]
MKKLLVFLTLLYSVICYSQKDEDLEILAADSTWLKELIRFPLSFAPDIDYRGYEDIRFAKNWNKPESPEFFTYAFVWNVNLKSVPTTQMLESNMVLYYDGLMNVVNKDKAFDVPTTKVDFEKVKLVNNDSALPTFKGRIQVYDAFFTNKVITLYATIETFYCTDQNKYMLLFRISTFNFEDSVWKKLKTVKLVEGHCGIGND